MVQHAGLSAGEALPRVSGRREDGRFVLAASGPWLTRSLAVIERELADLKPPEARQVRLDLSDVSELDTAGAWLLHRTQKGLAAGGAEVSIASARPEHARLLETIAKQDRPPPPPPAKRTSFVAFLERIGEVVVEMGQRALLLIAFLGQTLVVLGRLLLRPQRIRWRSVVRHIETSGLNALPIVGLISFLIGVVLSYQSAAQLAQFGAQIFTVNVVGVGVLREMGILLTAIIVAGRSGSAYTAQIGAMQVNEEVDALRALGLDPMEVLVLPRVLALTFTLPLLAFYADLMGLLGGAVMASTALDIPVGEFFQRLPNAVDQWDLFVGVVKAVPFAFMIAMVGCFEGFRVERSAESVGHATTRAVVEGVFLVIVLDAMLSIFFQVIGV